MITMAEARTRAAAGAAFLDRTYGQDWVGRIDVNRLNIGSSCRCILGQLYGEYSIAVSAFCWRMFDYNNSDTSPDAGPRGFVLKYQDTIINKPGQLTEGSDWDTAYSILQDAWIELIAARLYPVNEASVESGNATVACAR